MYSSKIQKSTSSNAHVSKPIYRKSEEAGFFSRSKESQKPFFSAYPVQAKLKVGQSGDKYEKEADATAEKVIQKFENPSPSKLLQKKCTSCEKEEKVQKKEMGVMRKPIFESENDSMIQTKSIENQLNASKGGGKPMEKGVRSNMESAFGTDFSYVKLHTDHASVQMNRDLNSRAFTNGSDVYFNQGQYSPQSSEGKRLLAHELTHVVQQRNDIAEIQRQQSRAKPKKRYLYQITRPNTDIDGMSNERIRQSQEYISLMDSRSKWQWHRKYKGKVTNEVALMACKLMIKYLNKGKRINWKNKPSKLVSASHFVKEAISQQATSKQSTVKPEKSIGEQVMEEIKQHRKSWCDDFPGLKSNALLVWCRENKPWKDGFTKEEYNKNFKKFNKTGINSYVDFPDNCTLSDPWGKCVRSNRVRFTKEQYDSEFGFTGGLSKFPKNCELVDRSGTCKVRTYDQAVAEFGEDVVNKAIREGRVEVVDPETALGGTTPAPTGKPGRKQKGEKGKEKATKPEPKPEPKPEKKPSKKNEGKKKKKNKKKKKKKKYLCTAKCQSNGGPKGAYYVYGTSIVNCGLATLAAKAAIPKGEYPRHCSCFDTKGFRGKGTQCESHK